MKAPRRIVSMIVAFIMFFPILSFAAAVSLPKTGEVTCYNVSGAVIPCAGTGQDGEIQAGIAWPSPRFHNNGNGTITDYLTGLTWPSDATTPTVGSCDGSGGVLTWQQALNYVACLNANNYLGKNTWRMPNVNELESILIIDNGVQTNSWLASQGFSLADYAYWTSTTGSYGSYFNSALCVSSVDVEYCYKLNIAPVWPVSGTSNGPAQVPQTGQTTCYDENGNVLSSCAGTGQDGELKAGVQWPNPRFDVIYCDANGPCTSQGRDCDDLDSTDVVIDRLTGLMWPKDGYLPNTGMAWSDALQAPISLDSGSGLCGYKDWHLPNEKQLHSLVGGYADPTYVLPAGHPFVNVMPSNYYWTSTSTTAYPGFTVYARAVQIGTGYVSNQNKTNDYYYFWPVRIPPAGSDISITQGTSMDPTEVGKPLTYTLTVMNLGPDDATGVTITDTLPSQVTFGSAVSTKGSCSQAGGTVTCSVGNMGTAETVTVTITVTAPSSSMTITNAANATCTSTDPNLSNNSTTKNTKVSNTYYSLTVNKDGTGTGTVTGQGINCGSTCAQSYLEQTVVTLKAVGDSNSIFAGWTGGGCSGLGRCRLTMDGVKNVTATFSSPRTSAIELPQTGQTTIYASGDDGNLRAGVAWPSPRFTNNGDGTMTDELTGLAWLKNANCIGTKYPLVHNDSGGGDGAVTWQHALDFIAGMNIGTYPNCAAGQSDWRLPNANELLSLLHARYASSADYLVSQGFTNVQNHYEYWTSTTDQSSNGIAYAVSPIWNYILIDTESNSVFVWPVRGTTSDPAAVGRTGQTVSYYSGDDGEIQAGVAWPSPRFTDHGNGTVTDKLTGLIWLKDTNCMATQYSSSGFDNDYTPGDGYVYWQHALDFVNGINVGTYANCGAGFTNWRLPNRNELQSLADLSKFYPALPDDQPFINFASYDCHWSSTTTASDSSSAYVFSSTLGTVQTRPKTPPYASWVCKVWPVRSASVVVSADLRVSKSDSPDPVLTGQPVTYTVTVTNNGPSTADGVTLTDTLPGGVLLVSANSTQGTCNQSGGTVTCNIGSMANLAVVTVTIVVNAPGSPDSITNTATVSSTTSDPDSSNNTATAGTTVKTAYDVDLAVTKSDSPDPVEIGHNVTYTVTVTNSGPDMAIGVVLTDTLPAGTSFFSADSTQATCGHTGQTVTCTIGTILKDAVVTITIVATAPNTTGSITNTATVSSTSNDSNSSNNTATASTVVYLNSGDISVSLSEYPNPVYGGQQVTYTVTISNHGPDTAKGVTLADTLPAGTGFKSVSSTQGTCSGAAGSVSCNIGDMANGATVTVMILITAPAATGSITNTATAASTNNDSNLTNNTDSKTTNVISPPAPVQGTLNLARTGQTSCYDASGNTINCTGTGQDRDIRAGISWPNPRFIDNVDGTLTDNLTGLMWLKDANCIGTQYPGYDTFQTAGDGLVSYNGALSFIYLVNGNSYQNCRVGYGDWRLPNVNELESLLNAGVPDLKAWLGTQGFTHVQDVYWSSTTFPTYDNCAYILYTNFGDIDYQQKFGPSISSGAVFLVRGTSNGPAPVWKTGQTASWDWGDDGYIRAGVAWPSPRFTDNSDGTVTDKLTGLMWLKDANCIKTQYPGFDNDVYQNGAAGDGAVYWQHAYDFVAGINKGDYRNCGQPYTDWRLSNRKELFSLMNYASPGLPSGHPFTNMPTYGSYWTSTSAGWGPSDAWSVFFWDGIVPQIMKEIMYGYTLSVWPVRGGTVPAPPADLSITKSASADLLLGGTNLTYTINVANNGPNTASGVTVQDTLPSGTTFVSVNPSTPTCSHSGGVVSCNLGTMANGAQSTITIVVTTPNASGWIRNVATVSPATDDPYIHDNTAFRDTRVYTAADTDSDGVTTTEESGPNGTNPNYDGNGDGIADSQQTNVTSMHTSGGSNYVTVASANGTSLSNVQASGNPSPGNSPPGVTFPYGFVGFTVEGVTAGGSTTVTIYLPAGANPNTYYKYGPEPGNPTDHWYEFLYDGYHTGAVISGNVITLYFVDGLRGDDDLTANGLIVDQGAPGFLVVDQTGPSLAITSHTNHQDVYTSSITLTGTASDSEKGNNGIQQVTVNGGQADNGTATGSGTANWSKTVSLSPGANTITVVAYDNSSSHNQTSQAITIYYISTIYVSKSCNGRSYCWDRIQNGVSQAPGPSIIEITQDTYNENIDLNVEEEIMLEGGWDTNFASCPSYTTIHGSMTITHGTIIIENIILK